MTKYLDPSSKQNARERKFVYDLSNDPPEGWQNEQLSSPLEDIREAKKLLEKEVKLYPSHPNEEQLREWGDQVEIATGRRPKTCIFDKCVNLPVPPRRQRSRPSRSDSGRR